MFPRRATNGIAAGATPISLIGAGLRIIGDIEVSSAVRIEANVIGNIRTKPDTRSSIIIGPLGRIEGSLHGIDVTIEGTVIGSIVSTGFIKLGKGARVFGDISYVLLAIEPGAIVDGLLMTHTTDGASENTSPQLPAEAAA